MKARSNTFGFDLIKLYFNHILLPVTDKCPSSAEGGEQPQKLFRDQSLHKSSSSELETHGSAVIYATNGAMEHSSSIFDAHIWYNREVSSGTDRQ